MPYDLLDTGHSDPGRLTRVAAGRTERPRHWGKARFSGSFPENSLVTRVSGRLRTLRIIPQPRTNSGFPLVEIRYWGVVMEFETDGLKALPLLAGSRLPDLSMPSEAVAGPVWAR